jgi:hypothetical protein
MVSYAIMERTKKTGDSDPVMKYRLDEFGSVSPFTTGTGYPPPYAVQHASYNALWYPIQLVGQRIQLSVTNPSAANELVIQNLGFVFQSEAGA